MPLEFIGTLAGLPEPQDEPSRFLHLSRGRYFLGDPGGGISVPATTFLDKLREWRRGPRIYQWRPLDESDTVMFVEFERLGEGTVTLDDDGALEVVGTRPERATHFETIEGFTLNLAEPQGFIGRQGIPPGRYPGEFFLIGEPVPHRLQARIVANLSAGAGRA